MSNGARLVVKNRVLDLFDDQEISVEFCDSETREDVFYACFNPINIEWSATGSIIQGEHIKIDWYDYIITEDPEKIKHLSKDRQKAREKYKGTIPVKLEIIREKERGMHYMI